MDNSREVKVFAVEEYHRGEWIPVLSKETRKPKVAKISVENAELLTNDALAQVSERNRTTMFRYVERKEVKKVVKKPTKKETQKDDSSIEDLRFEYKEVYGKKPFAGWDAVKLQEKINEKK